jgi:tetratricopeptide (TPR) repeat protein
LDCYQQALLALSDADNPHELSNTHKDMGVAYQSVGDFTRALHHFRQALASSPKPSKLSNERTIRAHLASLLLRRGRLIEAAVHLYHFQRLRRLRQRQRVAAHTP